MTTKDLLSQLKANFEDVVWPYPSWASHGNLINMSSTTKGRTRIHSSMVQKNWFFGLWSWNIDCQLTSQAFSQIYSIIETRHFWVHILVGKRLIVRGQIVSKGSKLMQHLTDKKNLDFLDFKDFSPSGCQLA